VNSELGQAVASGMSERVEHRTVSR
jgi:hypothetical protein